MNESKSIVEKLLPSKQPNIIFANTDIMSVTCKVCGKKIFKNNPKQIVLFCCKECRKER